MTVKISETAPKTVHVAGEVTVHFQVELPVKHQHDGLACKDPAVEAVLASLGQQVDVLLWGRYEPPVKVFLEVSEEDVVVEEDDRPRVGDDL